MGYYKVPQDVEAEDKLIGPFTFKQFIFIIVTFIGGFVAFQLAAVNFLLVLPLLPFLFVTALIGFYRPKDQPIENKVLAYLNFTFKPRKRLWSRDGIVEHVHIKAPKKVEVNYGDGRSQEQVRSQLKQLAQIVDTRGWSTKRSDLQEPVHNLLSNDDRLIQTNQVTVVQDIDNIDVSADDIYDQTTNPVAQAFGQRTTESEQQSREQLLAKIRAGVDAAASNEQQTTPAAYVNPYEDPSAKPATAKAKKTAAKDPEPELRQRLKDLEASTELPVSVLAARAQEFTVQHDDEPQAPGELTIQH